LIILAICGARKISGSSAGWPTLTNTRPCSSGVLYRSFVCIPELVGSSIGSPSSPLDGSDSRMQSSSSLLLLIVTTSEKKNYFVLFILHYKNNFT
jgi:hypothetical protein